MLPKTLSVLCYFIWQRHCNYDTKRNILNTRALIFHISSHLYLFLAPNQGEHSTRCFCRFSCYSYFSQCSLFFCCCRFPLYLCVCLCGASTTFCEFARFCENFCQFEKRRRGIKTTEKNLKKSKNANVLCVIKNSR